MVLAGAVLLFLAWRFDQDAELRRTQFPIVEARAKAIDSAAKMPEASNQSASALARLIKASEDSETGYRRVMWATGVLLLVLAALQITTLMPFLRKPSNSAPYTDARAASSLDQPPSTRAGERGR